MSVIAAEAAERELVDAAVMKGWRETESEGESEGWGGEQTERGERERERAAATEVSDRRRDS